MTIKRDQTKLVEELFNTSEKLAFIIFLKHEKLRHQEDIYKIDEDIYHLENE